MLRYLEYVAKKHDLKRDIQFNTRVTGAEFDEATNLWRVRTDKGEEVTAHYLITAVGILSNTSTPKIKGLEDFQGKWHHTSRFPRNGVDFTNKRVAVVGTGASAVQAIPEIAQQAKQLTVFQRTPLLARLNANKPESLTVLDRPEFPLHTNGSENDIRCHVTRRKVSASTRSDIGRDCRDAFLGLAKTCAKLEIAFWDFLGDRLAIPGTHTVPRLPEIILARAQSP
jgi:cation diffusion facilitator CzcD-associated flavoprotein CzcO